MGLNEILIRVLCIGSVVLYSASLSLISASKTTVSPEIVSKLFKIENSESSRFTAEKVGDGFLLDKLASQVNSLEPLFSEIGSMIQPLIVSIDFDHPTIVSVQAEKITLGTSALKANNQLKHAVVRAWILQNASSSILINPVRAEVAADILLSLYQGGLNLTDPENHLRADFDGMSDWIGQLYNTAELCGSAWRPTILIPYCKSLQSSDEGAVSAYSIRKVTGNLIWNELSRLGVGEKLRALKEISQQLRSTNSSLPTGNNSDENQLKSEIENTARMIYPRLEANLPEASASVSLLKGEKVFSIHGILLNKKFANRSRSVIYETCATPTADKLISATSESSEHILLVENCDGKKVNYESFAVSGITQFALQNREVRFAYLHRASLLLAKKMINNFDVIGALAYGPSSRDAKFLGLDQKIYRDDMDAYKVNGPIGAIEWFRAEVSTENGSRS